MQIMIFSTKWHILLFHSLKNGTEWSVRSVLLPLPGPSEAERLLRALLAEQHTWLPRPAEKRWLPRPQTVLNLQGDLGKKRLVCMQLHAFPETWSSPGRLETTQDIRHVRAGEVFLCTRPGRVETAVWARSTAAGTQLCGMHYPKGGLGTGQSGPGQWQGC